MRHYSSGGFGPRTRGGPSKARRSIYRVGRIRTNVYIDGFNLYYGSLKGGPHKWLDIDALFAALLPRNDIRKIRYFTARVEARSNDPDLPVRQDTYLRALASRPKVEVHFGSFMSNCVRAPIVEQDAVGRPIKQNGKPVVALKPNGTAKMEWVHKSEEKGSDVNLASYLLRDAFKGECECAVIVSNDSDLLTPIRIAREECGLTIGLILPRPNGSMALKQLAHFQKPLRAHALAASQFPEAFNDSVGTVSKPAGW